MPVLVSVYSASTPSRCFEKNELDLFWDEAKRLNECEIHERSNGERRGREQPHDDTRTPKLICCSGSGEIRVNLTLDIRDFFDACNTVATMPVSNGLRLDRSSRFVEAAN